MNSGENHDLRNIFSDIQNNLLVKGRPLQDQLRSILEESQNFLAQLQDSESFASTLNVSLISVDLMKRIDFIFGSESPRLLHPARVSLSKPITWLDVVTESNSKVNFKGSGIYEYRLLTLDVIVELSEFQHNMILSGLPRKLISPWYYERDIQTEIHALSLTEEATHLSDHLLFKRESMSTLGVFLFFTDLITT